MACMCGDYCCSSCGPAQGNSRCPICNQWVSEGCKHVSSRTGKLLKRYEKEAERLAKEEADTMAAEMEYEQKLIKEGLL